MTFFPFNQTMKTYREYKDNRQQTMKTYRKYKDNRQQTIRYIYRSVVFLNKKTHKLETMEKNNNLKEMKYGYFFPTQRRHNGRSFLYETPDGEYSPPPSMIFTDREFVSRVTKFIRQCTNSGIQRRFRIN
jgi:hypothetical protein